MFGGSFLVSRIRGFSVTPIVAGIALVAWPTIGHSEHLFNRSAHGVSSSNPLSASESDDEESLRQRVQSALHDDRYFYDAHVDVSIERGNVVLRGFVMSEWDLRRGLQIAQRAAGGRRVVNYLSIKLGGAR